MGGGEISHLYVRIGANLSGLAKGLARAFGAISSFAKSVGTIALGNLLSRGISSAFNTITGGIGAAIENGSALNETLSKTDVLLGNTADQAKKFAQNLEAKGLGSQAEILESYLGTVNQLTNQGMSKQLAQGLAAKLESRVGDVASQDNADPKMIRENLASAMAGEFQILRRYGVDASAEEQQASGKSRGQYVIDKFLSRTQRAEGDFDRTKYGYANLGRAADTKTTAVSTRIGQDLQIVGQAFQYFRGRFMDTIMQVANGGAFKKLGENIYTAFSYISLAIEPLVQPIITGLTNVVAAITGFAVRIIPYLVNASDTWKIITNRIAIALLSIWETITSIANKISLGLIDKQDMGGAKQILQEDNDAARKRIADSKAAFDTQIADLKAKFEAGGSGTTTGSGALGLAQQPVANAMKASSHAFNSLLSGVFGQKPDKQLAVLEQIANNTAPKETGAAAVTTKTTLATAKPAWGGFGG